MSHGTPACHLCGDAGETVLQLPDGQGAMRYCAECDFGFAWPVPPINPVDLFSRAYTGNEQRAEMHVFSRRLANRADKLRHPSLTFRSPIQPKALNWLEAHIPEGSTVLEIGCGVGGFMHALRAQGFHAVGNDVAEVVVRALENDGFEMWLGNLEDAPPEWPEPSPSAIACFFVLHHVPNPVAFLSAIRERWQAPLILGQYAATMLRKRKRKDVRQSGLPPPDPELVERAFN